MEPLRLGYIGCGFMAQRVHLPKQVAVYLLYWTAFASANGTMNFRADPYGWDKLLASKIEASSRRAATIAIASKD